MKLAYSTVRFGFAGDEKPGGQSNDSTSREPMNALQHNCTFNQVLNIRAASRNWTFSFESSQFSYNPPEIHSAKPNIVSRLGGSTIEIHGRNFGLEDSYPLISIGNRPCVKSSWISDALIICIAPAGAGLDLPVHIILCGTNNYLRYVRITLSLLIECLAKYSDLLSIFQSLACSEDESGKHSSWPYVRVSYEEDRVAALGSNSGGFTLLDPSISSIFVTKDMIKK